MGRTGWEGDSHNSASAPAPTSSASTAVTAPFLGASFGLNTGLAGLYQQLSLLCLEPPQWPQILAGAGHSLALCSLESQLEHPLGPLGLSALFFSTLALTAATLPAALEWTGMAAVSQTPAQSFNSAIENTK